MFSERIYDFEFMYPLAVNFLFSCFVFIFTMNIIPKFSNIFIKAKLYGRDLNKKEKPIIPEAFGVVSGCTFLVTMFLFMPFAFSQHILDTKYFPHNEFVEMVAALLSICCMLLLGFADDVLDLKWRHKLFLPTIASLPLLVVYYINFNSTTIIIPRPLRPIFATSVNLGYLYYTYMGMLAVFCTNAINILAGVNGLEVGQSIIIALSITFFNIIELFGHSGKAHLFSLYFMMPFIAVSVALLIHNWYPSKIFIGDTYCYFAGMTFAVVGILGHFSKTLMLFFIPQVFNFLYSLPQLFHLVPCPRHRMPRLKDDGNLEASQFEFHAEEISILGRLCLSILSTLKLISLTYKEKGEIQCNNLTLINLVLILFGPMTEDRLTSLLLAIQVVCSCLAFIVRYPLAWLFYDV